MRSRFCIRSAASSSRDFCRNSFIFIPLEIGRGRKFRVSIAVVSIILKIFHNMHGYVRVRDF